MLLRKLPSVHNMASLLAEMDKFNAFSDRQLTLAAQEAVEGLRKDIQSNAFVLSGTSIEAEVINRATSYLQSRGRLRKVINAAGVVIHTNLGRSRLGKRAIKAVIESANNYTNLEYDIEKGTRGSRHSHPEDLIKKLTGAEAAMVVNNNAAAVYLILSALAKGRETIVSRGELVEIGGSFRISSIMEESGAVLREVGTTNKTHLFDYEQTLNENTSMIMKVHTSNFKITGFTKSVPSSELVKLSREQNVILYEDLGSGALFPFSSKNIGDEVPVKDVIQSGVDIVSFSGDKLLGGPQAGIIAGKKEYISILKKHQLARVLRIDKLSLAALCGTLESYLYKEFDDIPTVKDIIASEDELKLRAEQFIVKMNPALKPYIIPGHSQVGGGTMPDVKLPSFLIAFCHPDGAEYTAESLRKNDIPVIVRIQEDVCLIDLRTVNEEEETVIINALKNM
ncbi:L-seryl-tRNA(Sec) selenium transferase [Fictibacillus aquaticus]|uniref:L-seryl-tRNA(Sec) selenium transferase n=2 Tax=Fictibacillus aquaticus TaxID=2021314 RepID=A0A235FGE3_9BACL|nr:L-seryl-tRNA(Sec) selenium transferase [Fictibacillus aquaticus]